MIYFENIKVAPTITEEKCKEVGFTNLYDPILFFNRVVYESVNKKGKKTGFTDSLLVEISKKDLTLKEIWIMDNAFAQYSQFDKYFRKGSPTGAPDEVVTGVTNAINELVEKGILVLDTSE